MQEVLDVHMRLSPTDRYSRACSHVSRLVDMAHKKVHAPLSISDEVR